LRRIRFVKNIFLLLTGAVLISAFQNCGRIESATNTGPSQQGGNGTDGFKYISYGDCGNGQVGVSNVVIVAADFSSATMVLQGCQTLPQPMPVNVADLGFVGGNTIFQLAGQVYDQQVGTSQRVTLEVCQATDGSAQAQVWEVYGAPSSFFGSVSTLSGSQSGTLNVQMPSSGSPTDFVSTAGQSSQFDLSTANQTLTYSLVAGTQKTSAVSCSSQSIPPSPPTTTGLSLDTNGWTIFNAGANTRKIYVSNSTGNDSNSGLSSNSPVKTLAMGVSLMRDGFPDWLLLNQGDKWTEQNLLLCAPGQSATQPALISTYGTGARPVVQVSSQLGMGIGSVPGDGCTGTQPLYLAISGVEFYAYDRDPASAGYAPATVDSLLDGALFQNPVAWLLLENNKFSFFETNVNIQLGGAGFVGLRRNVIVDAYSINEYGPGVYLDNVTSALIEENILDHNGWNATVPGAGPVDGRSNINITSNCGPVFLNGNLTAEASAEGVMVGAGSVTENNLFLHNPVGEKLSVGHSPSSTINNVFLEGVDINSSTMRGFGIYVAPNGAATVLVAGNIIKQNLSAAPATSYGLVISSGVSGIGATNNVICQWNNPIEDSGINNVTTPNVTNPTTCDGLGFADPDLTIESYDASLGGPGTLAHFIAQARLQSKAGWNSAFTANAANVYIRAGF
jgi:hypothetical protein